MTRSATGGSRHPSFLAEQVRDYRYFFLNLVPSPRSKLAVACGGWERCTADYEIQRADFAFYGIEYVAHGRGSIILNGVENKLVPGSVFAYRPFAAHGIRTEPGDPLVKYFIDFSGRDATRLISQKVFGLDGLVCLHDAQPIHEAYEQLLETGLRGGAWRRAFAPFCSSCSRFGSRSTPTSREKFKTARGKVSSGAGPSCKRISAPSSPFRNWPLERISIPRTWRVCSIGSRGKAPAKC